MMSLGRQIDIWQSDKEEETGLSVDARRNETKQTHVMEAYRIDQTLRVERAKLSSNESTLANEMPRF